MSSDAVDISTLTEAQQEALQTYTAVTDQDPLAAIPLLQRAEWNVQIAITRFFEGEPTTDLLAEAQAAIPPPTGRTVTNLQYDSSLPLPSTSALQASSADTVQRVDTTSNIITSYRPPYILSILLTPVSILYRILSTIFRPLSPLVPSFLTRVFANFFAPPRPSRRPLPPAETSLRFIREFNEEYVTENESPLPWTENGFNLSLDTAKSKQKFLLAVLISPSHDETNTFVRDVLLARPFREFLSAHTSDLLLWGGSIQDPEPYLVSTNLSCTKFPFYALICQTPPAVGGTNASGGSMTVVSRCAGSMTATEMVAKLTSAMTSQSPALRAARAQVVEREASQNLRREQDSAYERSLATDRERARKRREEEETRQMAEKDAQRKADEAEQWQRKREQWRIWRASSLHPEPGADEKDTVRCQIRLRDGSRVIRRFLGSSDLEELYAFVECHDLFGAEGTASSVQSPTAKPEGYEHEYKFILVSPMPRTVYGLEKGNTSVPLSRSLGKTANLIVEALQEDDDDNQDDEKAAGAAEIRS